MKWIELAAKMHVITEIIGGIVVGSIVLLVIVAKLLDWWETRQHRKRKK